MMNAVARRQSLTWGDVLFSDERLGLCGDLLSKRLGYKLAVNELSSDLHALACPTSCRRLPTCR